MSDTTGRTGVALPSRVRVGDRPKAATINSLIDAMGDRRVTLGSMPFRQPAGAAVEQFTVIQTDATHVKVYGGYWHRIQTVRLGTSAPYTFCPQTQSTLATDGGTLKFGTAVGATGDATEITETCKLWLKLDWTGAADVLTGQVLATPDDDPDMEDEGVYWLPISLVTFADGVITEIAPIHTGSIVTTDYGHPRLCAEDEEA
jgi:hypothetical protein